MGWNEITAAWVQAIGSILTIIVAVVVTQLQIGFERRRDRERGTIKARVLAIQFAPHIARIEGSADVVAATINDRECGLALVSPSYMSMESAIEQMQFGIAAPRKLFKRIDAFPVEAALALVELFQFIEDFDEYVRLCIPIAVSEPEHRENYLLESRRKFAAIAKITTSSKQWIGRLHRTGR